MSKSHYFNYNYGALSFATLGHSSADVGGVESTDHLLAVGVGDYENVNLLLQWSSTFTRLHRRIVVNYCFLRKNYLYYIGL
jgi:hypothetical protein